MKRVALIVLAVLLVPAAAGADKRKASEHFKRALAAEKRGDWQTALEEYTNAYQASPHPSVLFNIGEAHEKLNQPRKAVFFFERYLKESPDASDRARVKRRISALRERPSQVELTASPAGATVYIDGQPRGPAPLVISLPPGQHRLHVAHGGRRSATRTVWLQFGAPVKLHIDLDSSPGWLIVHSNVRGAEVKLNSVVAGRTPFRAPVPSGTYKIHVSKPGYHPDTRTVTVSARGTQQVRANLERLDGTAPTPENITTPAYLLGTGYGLDFQASAARYMVELGYRVSSHRLDLSGMLGVIGSSGSAGLGLGVQSRLYFATGKLRPYLRGGAIVAKTSETENAFWAEGSFGVLVVGKSMRNKIRVLLEYYLELGVSVRLDKPPETTSGESPGRVGVPLMGGVLIRYGSAPPPPVPEE